MPAKDPPATAPVPIGAASLRLTFAYRGRDVRLVSALRIAMIAPPPVTPAPVQGQSGYWCELRGATGDLLFHRAFSSLVRTDVEVFADDAGQSMRRVPVLAPEGQFDVLVPDLPEARTLFLFGTPAGAATESAPSHELFRANVGELRKARGDTAAPDPGTAPPPSDRK